MAATPAVGCNTADMLIIHRLFRRLFTDAPVLVRGVPDGDTARASVVADHVAEIAGGLHHHHDTEDTLLWDLLEARAPACALHVGQMRAQHAVVATLLTSLDEVLPPWRSTAAAADRERVAGVLDEILTALQTHLGDEEEQILPVAATSMSQQEWDRLGERGRAGIPRDRQLIQLGFILESFDSPEERREWVKANLPIPVRLLMNVVGRRQYESHKRKVYGITA